MTEVAQSAVADKLRIADDWTHWRELPPWLRFFFQLGERVATTHEAGVQTCAVVIPSRPALRGRVRSYRGGGGNGDVRSSRPRNRHPF